MYDYLPYIITDTFCALYALSTLNHLNASMGSEHEVHTLRNMIISYIVFIASNIIWAACSAYIIKISSIPYLAINAVCVLALTFGCYYWFQFVETRLHPKRSYPKIISFLVFAPVLIVSVLDLASIFTHWMFTVDQDGFYIANDLFVIQGITNFTYLLLPTVEFIIYALRTKSKEVKKEYITYAVYMVIPLTVGFSEDYFPNTPVLELSIFLMIHIFFIMIQNLQINNDALTGLNNRQRLGSYLRDVLPNASQEKPVFLSIIDIDSFKSINDLYGHVEGDTSLKAVARAIMHVADQYGAFAARYGGDEFCIVSKVDPGEMRKPIDDAVLAESASLPCQIHVSMGYAKCSEPISDPSLVLKCADAKLYEEKRSKHMAQ
jgi:diguanylate cyclase (GGDEF)-like protein